jgi:hypothetical protein
MSQRRRPRQGSLIEAHPVGCCEVTVFERLEDRLLLSHGGLWTITGDHDKANLNDTIVVDRDPDDPSMLRATVNGKVVATRPERCLRRIFINAGRGDDTIRVDTSGGKRLIPVTAHGGRGNDTLIGGPEADDFYGDAGGDTLRGGGGRDLLCGGPGKDYIYAEANVDRPATDRSDILVQDDDANPIKPLGTDEALRDWLIKTAVAQWGGLFGTTVRWWWPWWKGGGGGPIVYAMDGSMPFLAALPEAGTGAPSHSGTNNQVAGVEEGDIAKTDGNYIYLLRGQEVVIASSWPAEDAHVESRQAIEGSPLALYLYDDPVSGEARLTVLSEIYDSGPVIPMMGYAAPLSTADAGVSLMPWRWHWDPRIKVTMLDVTDRSQPAVAGETYLDGWLAGSRAVGDRVILVVQNDSPLPEPQILEDPDNPYMYRYESQDDYVTRLETADLDKLLPSYSTKVQGAGGEETVEGALAEAPSMYIPAHPSGNALVSVAVFDVDDGAGPVSTTSTFGLGGTVYASTDSLYMASTSWQPATRRWHWSPTTFIYKFDLTKDGVPLAATGSVAGSVLDQYSMDEYDGNFRIATTDSGDGLSSNVFVLGQQGADLNIVGSITGLALGEQIRSVRFMQDRGFVVTFRQVDPLFALDLSGPANPRVAGELKIPGYSSYLHPMDSTHLIGFGRDADPGTGRVQGLQLSLFDVSDLSRPTLVDKYVLTDGAWSGFSAAEWDPHAFSYFPDYGVLALPVADTWWGYDVGLQVFHVDAADGFTRMGEVKHDTPVERTFQIGDCLFSISSDAIKANSIADPAEEVASVDLK